MMMSRQRSALAIGAPARAAVCLLKCADIIWGRTICRLGVVALSVTVGLESAVNLFGRLTPTD